MNTKISYMGLLLAFALILSYIETLIPFQFGIPGIKLGLANLAVILTLYLIGYKEAFLLTVVKAVLCGFLFGNLTMIIYSLAGALASFFSMALMAWSGRFHLPVVSAVGGVMHNMGQIAVACVIVSTYGILYYVPALIPAGLLTGILIGVTASLVMPYIRRIMERGNRL